MNERTLQTTPAYCVGLRARASRNVRVIAGLALLGVLGLAIFWGETFIDAVDGWAQAYVVCALLEHHTFYLDDYPEAHHPFMSKELAGHWVSKYGIGVPILSAPFFLATSGLDAPQKHREEVRPRSRLAAGTMVLVFALVVYLVGLRLMIGPVSAAALSAATVLGTTLWSSASQDLFQHGFVAMALAVILLLVLRQQERPALGNALGIGACLGFVLLCRPVGLVMGACVAAIGLVTPSAFIGVAFGGLPFVALQVWYNVTHLHAVIASGYGDEASQFTSPLHLGLPGILVSPSRGLFVYSPHLLLSLVAVALGWQHLPRPRRALLGAVLFAALVYTGLIAKWHAWPGGWSYGPRLMTEVAAMLGIVLLLTYETWRTRRVFVWCLGLLAILATGVHGLHVFWPNDAWNAARSSDLKSAAFDLTDTQVQTHWRIARGLPR